ncbi:MAG: protein translocase subunit SecF [Thermodesulfovibrionales bacterium]|nr:protein translocase subunit SecF [Thermodesulfovibrionales bacterium]
MIELLKNTKIDFMGKRVYAYFFTGVLFMLGITAIVQIALGNANLGVDFVGGTSVQVKFEHPVPLSDVRESLSRGGIEGFDIQDLPAEDTILIRMLTPEVDIGLFSKQIEQVLTERFLEASPTIEAVTEIGPRVSERLKHNAIWAIFLATTGLLTYISLRFQSRFGAGAVIATVHDVLAVLGIFFLMDKEINLIFISAILAIAGYSLSDTVVVFDRIRENMKKMLRKPMEDIVNRSVNEVLPRTIITSLTTSLAAFSLLIFGGEVLHDFAFTILVGIAVGTYSSIFVASSFVMLFVKKNMKAVSVKQDTGAVESCVRI